MASWTFEVDEDMGGRPHVRFYRNMPGTDRGAWTEVVAEALAEAAAYVEANWGRDRNRRERA